MQIMYYGRRGKNVAETVKKLCIPNAELIACDSFEEVLESIAAKGGNPFKIGVIPILQNRPDDYKTLCVINNLHLVSKTYIPLQVSVPAQKVKSASLKAYNMS